MAATASRHTAASNSLHSRLHLENQYMQNERFRAGSSINSHKGVAFKNFPSHESPPRRARQPETPTVQQRRTNDLGQRRFPLQSHHPARPQLMIDVNTLIPKPKKPAPPPQETQNNMKIRRSKNSKPSPPSIPYSSTVQAEPTPVSDGNHNSVCQSPSWEAYDKRKQDKKEEKRLKDEAKSAKKPRRLSKAPPASSVHALAHCNANQSEPAIMSNGKKTRPTSMALPDSPSQDEAFYKQPRSRAGSFTSLVKSKFDFRRSSIDQSPETPFIGGIKLEFEQHIANRRESLSTDDQSDVHPALRHNHADSASALDSPPSRPTDSKTSSSRAYPPNTFRTTKSKSMLPVSTTAPALPDLSTVEKWRARVGLKSSRKSLSSSESPSQGPELSDRSSTSTSASYTLPAVTSVFLDGQKNNADKSSELGVEACKEIMPADQDCAQQVTAPKPPPRSPKRNNTINTIKGSSSTPIIETAPSPLATASASSSVYDLPLPAGHNEIKQPSASSSSWENLQDSVISTIESTIKPMGHNEKTETAQECWNPRPWPLHSLDVPNMTCSSSEDSVSDCYNTVSMPSTPDTSRPQSEKAISRISIESDMHALPRIELHDKAYASEACSFVSASSSAAACDREEETDPIQTAARKVLAALPSIPAAKHTSVKRTAEHEPLKIRSKCTDSLVSSGTSLADVSRQSSKNRKAQPAKRGTGDTIAKVFVECCGCKFYHDLPSKLYEAMINPGGMLRAKEGPEFADAISMTVRCPWCKHAMSTSCCAGLAAMVYVKERLH